MRDIRRGLVLLLVAALLLGAVAVAARSARDRSHRRVVRLAAALTAFDSCDALRQWLRDDVAPRLAQARQPRYLEKRSLAAGAPVPAMDIARSAATTTPPEPPGAEAVAHSSTNVQVAGIDEPDVVKNDGRRILVVHGTTLQLVSAGKGRVLDTLALPSGDAQLLLAGDRALVITTSQVTPVATAPAESTSTPLPAAVQLVQVDLTRDRLDVVDRVEVEGAFVAAREHGHVVQVVLHADAENQLGLVAPQSDTPEARAHAIEANRGIVDRSRPQDWLPRWRRIGDRGQTVDEGSLLECRDVSRPATFSGLGVLDVLSLDLDGRISDAAAAHHATGVIAAAGTAYATAEHLYVATTEYTPYPRSMPRGLEPTRGGTAPPLPAVPAFESGTDIHRFDISSSTAPRYELSGHVEGTLLSQFAMDEHDGVLRVATTTGLQAESHVVVLEPRDGALVEIGRVDGLGRGEQLYGVRFIGDVGYVVTFRQLDPLFTIDLSDPRRPRVAGRLELPGYSAYLHPVADGFVLGVGADATDTGRRTGAKVELFDVRDPARPRRVADAVVPGEWSPVERDHHAFLWWQPSKLAVVPLTSGMVAYTVDVETGKIAERGRLDAVASAQRAFIVGDRLWTLSSTGLQAYDLATLTPGATVQLS